MSESAYIIYDPSQNKWYQHTRYQDQSVKWTDDKDLAAKWWNFEKARGFSQSLPNKHGLRVDTVPRRAGLNIFNQDVV